MTAAPALEIVYGGVVGSTDRTVYLVQTNHPHADPKEPGNAGWSSYTWTAYTHRDHPGGCAWRPTHALFMRDEYHHLLTCAERATYRTVNTHRFNEVLAYLTPERALEAARVLREVGVLSSPYENDADWAKRNRGLPLKVRVVEQRLACIERIVEGLR